MYYLSCSFEETVLIPRLKSDKVYVHIIAIML